jgi:non-ribosomal peptide synthetase component F
MVQVDGSAAATVFFTSGTTGGPKGVISPHRAVSRLFRPGGLPGFGPGHATPLAAALPWDMYAFELWGQLSTGGTSVLVDGDYLLPGSLRDLVRSDGVDTVWLTTSLFNLFVDEDPGCFGGVGQIYIGGEKASAGHIRRFLQVHPGIPVYNTMGPAESCMVAVWHRVRPADCDVPGGVPVGRPAPATEVFVLRSDYARCRPGEVGEVCIGGDGLAVGYLRSPGQTAERFVTVTIDGIRRRLYRSGDLGVVDADGILHFRGRADRQVKISGQRIELDEIESVTREVTGVRDCVVIPVTGPDGRVERLVLCYLAAAAASGSPDPLDVSGHLKRVLPAYLVPATVWAVERFPVTANGKRDLAALLRLGQQVPRNPRRKASADQ